MKESSIRSHLSLCISQIATASLSLPVPSQTCSWNNYHWFITLRCIQISNLIFSKIFVCDQKTVLIQTVITKSKVVPTLFLHFLKRSTSPFEGEGMVNERWSDIERTQTIFFYDRGQWSATTKPGCYSPWNIILSPHEW